MRSIGFKTDPKGENFRIMLVDDQNLSESKFMDSDIELYRTDTSVLRGLNVISRLENNLELLHLRKDSFVKIIYMKKNDAFENLEFITNTIQKKDVVEVSKNIRDMYSLKKRKSEDIEKLHRDNSSENVIGNNYADYGLYGYNAFFGWTSVHESVLPISLVRMAKTYVDNVLKIPAGFRDNTDRSTQKKLFDITEENICESIVKHMFRVSSRNDMLYGACQWVSAAMLIDLTDTITSMEMMNELKLDPSKFRWKYMYKGNDSLSATIRRTTRYNLVKVKYHGINYIPFLFKATCGRYVCVIQDNNYGQNHVVGISCDSNPKLIWDCAETNAMILTQENLNRCAGNGLVCISIKCIGELKLK